MKERRKEISENRRDEEIREQTNRLRKQERIARVRMDEERKGKKRGKERNRNHSQFVPLDVVEEVFVCAHSLGLDRFEQVLAVVCEGTHQEVLLITATKQHITIILATVPRCISFTVEVKKIEIVARKRPLPAGTVKDIDTC